MSNTQLPGIFSFEFPVDVVFSFEFPVSAAELVYGVVDANINNGELIRD